MSTGKSDNKDLALRETALPAALAPDGDRGAGTEELQQVQVLPWLYVVQGMTKDEELKQEFGDGACVLMPDRILVAERGATFHVVPLLFWVSWRTERDQRDESGFWIVDRTRDPRNRIAQKARDPGRRIEVYQEDAQKPGREQRYYRHVECLSFVVALLDGEAAGAQAIVTYSKGAYKYGARLVSYLRRPKPGPNGSLVVPDLFVNRIALRSDLVRSARNEPYYALLPGPGKPPWIAAERRDYFAATHRHLADLLDRDVLASSDETPGDASGEDEA